MAVAIAICKCSKCGKLFSVKRKYFKNRSDANRWREWKESDYNLCKKCENEIANAEIKKKMKDHKIVEVHYSIYKNYFPDVKIVFGSYNSDTKTIKLYLDKNNFSKLKKITTNYNIDESL